MTNGGNLQAVDTTSHPTRGAWIEIFHPAGYVSGAQSHPSRGAWIEIAMRALDELEVEGRTPRGVRGLKYKQLIQR